MEQHQDEQDKPTRRSTCNTRPIERLEHTMTGKSYAQTKKVTFKNNKYTRLEYFHNLFVQTKADESCKKEYETHNAMLMARLINNLNNKTTIQGASFAQQYLIQKGLKVFGHK